MSMKPVTLGQVTQIRKMAVEKGIARDVFQIRLDDGTFAKFLDSLRPPVGDLARWSDNYYKLFNQRPDLSRLCIPAKPEGVGPMRLIVVAQELGEWSGKNHGPLQGVMETLKEKFACWQYANDLDADIPTNDRGPENGSYAVWVRDVREADEEFADKSANDLKAAGHLGITILERQLFEWDYYSERGEHLDQENVTLCTGSRARDGYVSGARWRSGFSVGWFDARDRNPSLRSRRVWV